MMKVIKKQGNIIEAYRLGEESEKMQELLNKGLVVEKQAGIYEVFSQEAVNGKGEIAYVGEFLKIDSKGMPYPNKIEYFLNNHRRLGENKYEQIPKSLEAWTCTEEQELCEEILYLMEEKGLVIDKENENAYYTAPLWGTLLSAAKNAVIIFYKIERADDGKILDIDFNFVERNEFEKTYQVIS